MDEHTDFQALIEEKLRGMSMMDDAFMTAVLDDNPEGTEAILRTVLGKPDLKVVRQQVARKLQNLRGRTSVLDVFATDSQGAFYDIEVQNAPEGADPRRARYYSGLLDSHELQAGQSFHELPDSYVIFIAKNDVRGKGRPIYSYSRADEEDGEKLGDGSTIVFVNCEYADAGTEIGRLISDLKATDPDTMHCEALACRADAVKNGQEGGGIMGQFLEDLYEEASSRGFAKGEAEGRAKGEAEGRAKGEAEGRAKGAAEGKAEGKAEGRVEGRVEAFTTAARNLVDKLGISAEEALSTAGVPEELQSEILKQIR